MIELVKTLVTDCKKVQLQILAGAIFFTINSLQFEEYLYILISIKKLNRLSICM